MYAHWERVHWRGQHCQRIDTEQQNYLVLKHRQKMQWIVSATEIIAWKFLSDASISMMHLSRWAEEFTWWNSSEFSYIAIDDSFCTGSSIMPQKKNPDMAELLRGKVGRVYGDLMQLLTVMKGTPLAYNKDFQEEQGKLILTRIDNMERQVIQDFLQKC